MTETESPQGARPEREEGYNGWRNYATWTAYSWLSSYEGSYNAAQGMVEAAGDTYHGGREIKDWIETNNPLADEASLYADILGWALQGIDWDELARAFEPEDMDADSATPGVSDI